MKTQQNLSKFQQISNVIAAQQSADDTYFEYLVNKSTHSRLTTDEVLELTQIALRAR